MNGVIKIKILFSAFSNHERKEYCMTGRFAVYFLSETKAVSSGANLFCWPILLSDTCLIHGPLHGL
jgi:hypothetical protein